MATTTPRAFPHFKPPGCPRPECRNLPPNPDQLRFCRLYGTKSYELGIPLYFCERCRHRFSLRRFSVEFYLHRADKTPAVIAQLVSSCSLRQAARANNAFSRAAIERRLERFGLHAQRLLRRAVRERLALGGEFQLDEAETFERSRLMGPLTASHLLHRETRYTVATAVATLAPRIRRGDRRWKRALEGELLPRRNRSHRAVSRCFAALARSAARCAQGTTLLVTDQKPSYRAILRRVAPSVRHVSVPGSAPRRTSNPLFPINHLLAMTRDGLSRLRRRTWCATKKRRRLWHHLGIYFAWKNFVRPRFNEEPRTPAQLARVVRRRWRYRDLVRWRLDLGKVSLSPWESVPAGAR